MNYNVEQLVLLQSKQAGLLMSVHVVRRNEIRIQFKGVPGNLYRDHLGYNSEQQANELVIRVQPDEAIYVTINNKVPGLGIKLDRSRLNLLYRQE